MGHAGFGALHSNGVGGYKARTFTMLGQAAHQREKTKTSSVTIGLRELAAGCGSYSYWSFR